MIRYQTVGAAVFYIQYLSYWFLLIKNPSSQHWLVTAEIFTFLLLLWGICVIWINISESANSFMTGWGLVPSGERKILSHWTEKNSYCVAVDDLICCSCLSTRERKVTTRERVGAKMRECVKLYNKLHNICARRTELSIYYLNKHLVRGRVSSLFTKYVFWGGGEGVSWERSGCIIQGSRCCLFIQLKHC